MTTPKGARRGIESTDPRRSRPARPERTTTPASDLIGHEGQFRLPGGRTVYEAVQYNCATARSDRPRLSRLDVTGGLHQIDRHVDWDQPIEVLRDFTAEYEAERTARYEAER